MFPVRLRCRHHPVGGTESYDTAFQRTAVEQSVLVCLAFLGSFCLRARRLLSCFETCDQ